MKKIIYIVVRYSMLIENSKTWSVTDADINKYRENLFNGNRLERRLKLFSNITLPSIVGQVDFMEGYEFKLFVVSSDELPINNQKELNSLAANYEWMSIHYLPRQDLSIAQPIFDDLESYGKEVLYATIKLDDDDALSVNFLKEFNKLLVVRHIGYAISFGRGLCGFYNFSNNQYEKIINYYYPKIALGLGYINLFDGKVFKNKIKTLFQAGGYTKIDRYVPTIVYSKDIMYMYTIYEHSDSYTEERARRLKKLPSVNASIIKKRFNIPNFDSDYYTEINRAHGIAAIDKNG